MKAIWQRHLLPHQSPGLVRQIWLARQVSPSSITAPCASLLRQCARWTKRTITQIEEDRPIFQGYTNSCVLLLDPPNKLSIEYLKVSYSNKLKFLIITFKQMHKHRLLVFICSCVYSKNKMQTYKSIPIIINNCDINLQI